jgi:hypothetical protein
MLPFGQESHIVIAIKQFEDNLLNGIFATFKFLSSTMG